MDFVSEFRRWTPAMAVGFVAYLAVSAFFGGGPDVVDAVGFVVGWSAGVTALALVRSRGGDGA